MVNEVMDVLVSLGLAPQKISSNVLKFSNGGLKYVFQADLEDDPSFFRLMLPDIEANMDNMNEIYRKTSEVSSRFKVGKCVIIDKKVWLAAEGFYYDKSTLPLLINRLIDVLHDMIKVYWNYGKESAEGAQK